MERPINGVMALSGMTRSGMPLSLNRAPCRELDPWVARIVVARIDAVPGFETECGMFTDVAYQRLLLGGEWRAETVDGQRRFGAEPILLGPQSRIMRVRCRGPLSTIGVGFRPGALRKLIGREIPSLMDRIEPGDPLGLLGHAGPSDFSRAASAEEWADLLERRLLAFIRRTVPDVPDPLSTAFEHASFADPNISPGEFALQHGVSLRTVERMVRRDFGLTPRTVLRRARALDLAAQLLGVAHEDDEDEFVLRYFDQSHRIREFQAFFGLTPEAFRAKPRILMTINLEARAARRLEVLNRLAPGDCRPWQDAAVN
jgi:AraC-like DNA-binding protein